MGSTSTERIAGLCLECEKSYQSLRDALCNTGKEVMLLGDAVQNELGRFRIWVNSIGAMHVGRRSLNDRLTDATHIYQNVISLLEDINETLKDGCYSISYHSDVTATSIANNDHENLLCSHIGALEAESDTSESQTSDSNESSEPVNERTLLHGFYDQLVNFVNKLFNLSALIRKASRNFRMSRAAAHIEKDADGNNVLLEFKSIVAMKIRLLYPQTPDWLVNCLSDVISKRRQQFYYQRAHSRRRANVRLGITFQTETREMPTSITTPTQMVSSGHQGHVMLREQREDPNRTPNEPTMRTYTTVSEVILESDTPDNSSLRKPTPTEIRNEREHFPESPKNR